MIYPEFLRVRRVITWAVIVISVLLLLDILTTAGQSFFPEHIHASVEGGVGQFPLSPIFLGLGFAVAGIVTMIGCNLARYREYADVVLTLPMSRTRFAVSVLVIDAAALLVSFVLAILLIIVIPFTINGVWPHVVFDPGIPTEIGIALGAVFLWFSLLAAISAWMRGSGGAIAGLSWLVFGLLNGLSHLNHPVWTPIFRTLNYLNPMMYLAPSPAGMPAELRIPFLFIVSLVFCIIAVAGWNRQEN